MDQQPAAVMNTPAPARLPTTLLRLCGVLGALLLSLLLTGAAQGVAAPVAIACPAVPAGLTVPNGLAGKQLTNCNFVGWDLTRADFSGATLQNALFVKANLSQARFDGASLQSGIGGVGLVTDFSFATLGNASFVGAKFDGRSPVYLTHAILTCTDFSGTDILNGKVAFGPAPLNFDRSASCRTKFQGATMNCEFVADWPLMDLDSPDIDHRTSVRSCLAQLAGRDFSNGLLGGVDLSGAVLDGMKLQQANLRQAVLDKSSLQCVIAPGGDKSCVDLSNADLTGATLNGANLSGASLYGAVLSSDAKVDKAASLRGAQLRNVNLATAQLSGTDFTSANLYGTLPSNPNGCATTGKTYTGFTIDCTSLHGASLTGTKFIDAYAYGVDFGGAKIVGANFSYAVLAGANFSGAQLSTDANNAGVTSFYRAHLQGTNLGSATLSEVDFSDAYLDFRGGGNTVYINLSGAVHNAFTGCPPTGGKKPACGQDVCVLVRYPQSAVPGGNTTITCADGNAAGPLACGAGDPSNTRWASSLSLQFGKPPIPGPPAGWYENDATYTRKPPLASEVCAGKGTNVKVVDW